MPRYFLKLAYEGSPFHGWQIQKNAASVQETIENAIEKITQQKIMLTGCGRTDTGVHATCFYAHLDIPFEITNTTEFTYKLNCVLPQSIAIEQVIPTKALAHARFDATQRRYEYLIHYQKNPFLENRSLYLSSKLNIKLIEQCFPYILGKHDFSCFSKSKTQVNNNFCDVNELKIEELNNHVVFTVGANRFLRGMVRAMVGTFLNVSSQKISPEHVKQLMDEKDRKKAGESVPPYALYLVDVKYPSHFFTS